MTSPTTLTDIIKSYLIEQNMYFEVRAVAGYEGLKQAIFCVCGMHIGFVYDRSLELDGTEIHAIDPKFFNKLRDTLQTIASGCLDYLGNVRNHVSASRPG